MTTWDDLKAHAVAPLTNTPPRGGRRTNPGTCTAKTSFSSKRHALNGATGVARKQGDRRMRPYLCNICHRWHLTQNGRTT